MASFLSDLFPLLYGACFLVLLWQAFRVMAQGFRAVPRPGDPVAAAPSQEGSGDPSASRASILIPAER